KSDASSETSHEQALRVLIKSCADESQRRGGKPACRSLRRFVGHRHFLPKRERCTGILLSVFIRGQRQRAARRKGREKSAGVATAGRQDTGGRLGHLVRRRSGRGAPLCGGTTPGRHRIWVSRGEPVLQRLG